MTFLLNPAMNLVLKAHAFATKAHAGQVRDYTGEPYILHCVRVACGVYDATHDHEMVTAALLHDTVEDCDVPLHLINHLFGVRVAHIVAGLTNPTKNNAANIERLADEDADVQTVKVFDVIDNCATIADHDPKRAATYLPGKLAMVNALTKVRPDLRFKAYGVIREGLNKLKARA